MAVTKFHFFRRNTAHVPGRPRSQWIQERIEVQRALTYTEQTVPCAQNKESSLVQPAVQPERQNKFLTKVLKPCE